MKYLLEEEYDYEFRLIGISCHAKDYRLCWSMNRFLQMGLIKEEKDLDIVEDGMFGGSSHSLYSYYDEETHSEFFLIANRDSSGFLVPEQKQADYLLMIRESLPLDLEAIIKGVRSLDLVLTCFEIDVASLKSRKNLIF